MKLICETVEDVKFLSEASESGKKNFYIEGIFMQADIPNRNKRMYPKEILEKEAARYTKELIENNRAYGELGHPQGPGINLDRVSHIITELKQNGSDFYGKARLTDTPMGNIAKGIMESGGKLGVSTRGLGSVKSNASGINEVQKDFFLATAADIVADPSAPNAFVNGIMEGVEYFWDNGLLKSQEMAEQAEKQIEESSRKKQLTEEQKLQIFKNFLESLKN